MKTHFFKILILTFVASLSVSVAAAQDAKSADGPPADPQRPTMRSPNDQHVELLHRLGLTEEQVQQIKKIHMDQKPIMDQAQKRLREANRALNDAIYADQVNDADVQARLSELQIARGEFEKIRYTTELSVRRLLTQEQLVRFRELRQNFEQMRKGMEMHRNERQFDHGRPDGNTNKSPDSGEPAQPVKHAEHKSPVI